MTNYCKYCDSLVNSIVKELDSNGNVIWIGCRSCYREKMKNDKGPE